MAEIVKFAYEDVKEFDNAEDFIKYYNLNKAEMDTYTTCFLNKKYKINGYQLGRKKGKLLVIPNALRRQTEYDEHRQDTTTQTKLDVINQKLDLIIKFFNQLSDYH